MQQKEAITTQRRTRTPEQARAALMRLCARAEKCEGDARRLMRGWGLTEEQIREVLARLVQERFIDDARYTEAFVREKLHLSGWGVYKIRAALQRKGIAAGLILSLWWRAAQVQQKSRDENRFSEAPACRRITSIPNQGEENGY